ncbi:uncharacterized protein [Henckelia pumila]
MADEEEICDDFESIKSGKVIFTRCSPAYCKKIMEELKVVIGNEQMSRIKETPFGKWIDMPVLPVSSDRVDYLFKRFDSPSCSFVVGGDISIPFTSRDFSIVLGLHQRGQQVDLDLKLESSFLSRHFGEKISNTHRIVIKKKLVFLASSNVEADIDDFVRMFILFIFNSVIFSTGNYITPAFIFPYIDELSTFFEFGWEDAAFRFLYRELDNQASKLYLDGCTAGLMAWFYERVPSLAVPRGVHICPRLFRFEKSKIKLDAVKAEVAFDAISSTKVLSIHPFPEEEMLLENKLLLPVSKEQGGSRDNCELEKIVNKQIAEIKMLKRTCAQLKRERVGAKRKLFDLKENMDLEKEFARNRKGKDIVVDNDLSVDDAADGMNETDEQEELSASHDLWGNLNDFVDVPVNNCVDLSENLNAEGEVVQKLVETKISDIGELKKGEDVCADGLGKGKGVAGIEFEMKESIGVDDLGDGKGIVGAELGRDKNEESCDMGMKKKQS